MKTQLWVYLVTGLLAAGAALAVAGLPDTSQRGPTIVPPSTTEVSDPVVDPAASVPESEPSDDGEDAVDTGSTPTTVAPEPADADDVVDPGAGTTTSTAPAPTTTVVELPDRSTIAVTVANGAGIGGVASRTVQRLADIGYVDAAARDGLVSVETTAVYAAADLADVAERLANDLGLPDSVVAPLVDAPAVDTTDEPSLVVYLGADVDAILAAP